MKHPAVNWTEGMFLRPQHFQASDMHAAELVSVSQQWDHVHGYGLRMFPGVSEKAITNYEFEITNIQARMKDGTLVSLAGGLDRIPLREALTANETVRIFLAVPRRQPNGCNVAEAGYRIPTRFIPVAESLPDDSLGGNDQEIEFRRLNVCLKTSAEESPGYELLPIAQVRRAGDGKATPALDRSYIPPVLCVEAWQNLEHDFVRAVYDMIGAKLDVVSEQIRRRGMTSQPRDIERFLILRTLNEALATTQTLAFSRGVHPFNAYCEFARIVGMLSFLAEQRRVDAIPPYDHDNLEPVFRWLRDKIDVLLKCVVENQLNQRMFTGLCPSGRRPRMQVTFNSEWLGPSWEWFVGVQVEGIPPEKVEFVLTKGLDWKLGSSEEVDSIFDGRRFGVDLAMVKQVRSELPSHEGWQFFRVSKDPANPAWNGVLRSETLAMRFNENIVKEVQQLDGRDELVLENQGRRFVVRFCLFAVLMTNDRQR